MTTYYVVSEQEMLERARTSINYYDEPTEETHAEFQKAVNACRQRPVPEDATHFYWETEERNGLGVPVERYEEIRK